MFDINKMQKQALFDRIKAVSNEATAKMIVYGTGAEEPNWIWVNETMRKMEEVFDEEALIRIRMDCQCGYGMEEKKALVRELYESASNMEEFADNEKAHHAGLFLENGELYLSFPYCPCPMLADVDRLETKTWCYCTMGYSKKLFEDVWECEVKVELLKSIKAGDDLCLMKIIPTADIW